MLALALAWLSRSLSPFALSTGTRLPVEPQRYPFPGPPLTAHAGASKACFQVERNGDQLGE